jgi:hypothetical protein
MTVRLLKVKHRNQEVARRRRQWSSTSCSSWSSTIRVRLLAMINLSIVVTPRVTDRTREEWLPPPDPVVRLSVARHASHPEHDQEKREDQDRPEDGHCRRRKSGRGLRVRASARPPGSARRSSATAAADAGCSGSSHRSCVLCPADQQQVLHHPVPRSRSRPPLNEDGKARD